MLEQTPLYHPRAGTPMRIVVFASGGGGNLQTAIDTARDSEGAIEVALVVTDRLGIPAIDIAHAHGIPVIAGSFEATCGTWRESRDTPEKADAYRDAAEHFHDAVLARIEQHESTTGARIDIAVLSYHRLIRGALLRRFANAMINQHPADLSVMRADAPDQRRYVGMTCVRDALQDGMTRTRTTNFIVREGCDTGELLCAGPWVSYAGTRPVVDADAWEHEIRQKQESDRPCLRFVLNALSRGRYGLHPTLRHADGLSVVMLDGVPLPYQGYDMAEPAL